MEEPRQLDWPKLPTKSDEEKTTPRSDFPPVEKIFYAENSEVSCVTAEKVGEFRSANNHAVVKYPELQERPPPGLASNPVTSFEEAFAKYSEILRKVSWKHFKKLSPIQSQVWPILLKGHDLTDIAQIGIGKPLAFLLSAALVHIDSQALQGQSVSS